VPTFLLWWVDAVSWPKVTLLAQGWSHLSKGDITFPRVTLLVQGWSHLSKGHITCPRVKSLVQGWHYLSKGEVTCPRVTLLVQRWSHLSKSDITCPRETLLDLKIASTGLTSFNLTANWQPQQSFSDISSWHRLGSLDITGVLLGWVPAPLS